MVLQILKDFPSAKLPMAQLLQAAPLLKPRQFSISSSPAAHPGRVHVTVAEVDYRTPFRRHIKGVCSTWLAALQVGYVHANCRTSSTICCLIDVYQCMPQHDELLNIGQDCFVN